jgi:GDPmannose 4,6-dehydratase
VQKTALITGLTGQDGAYLADLLLKKGYVVHGLRQPVAVEDTKRLENLIGGLGGRVTLHYADLTDSNSLLDLVKKTSPDEIYNLAAQSHVHVSFAVPDLTLQVNAGGALRLLEAIRILGLAGKTKFFQASTSELFGDAPAPQNEQSHMCPHSPYAAAKLYAYNMTRIYREAYGVFAANGIMFNHESPLRGEEFVTRKIAKAVADIVKGRQSSLRLGNLDARRDWSHAQDIMSGAWLMLQQNEAHDYILSSGESRSVRDFVNEAFAVAGIMLTWQGSGTDEIATDARTGVTLVRIDPDLFRPLEVDYLLGDSSKARQELGWLPQVSFQELVKEMVEAELATPSSVSSDIEKLTSYA